MNPVVLPRGMPKWSRSVNASRTSLMVTLAVLTACATVPGALTATHEVAGDGGDCGNHIVVVRPRGDVIQSYLLSSQVAVEPKVVALMFPGGSGRVGLSTDGPQNLGQNFLVRTKDLFCDADVAVAILDSP